MRWEDLNTAEDAFYERDKPYPKGGEVKWTTLVENRPADQINDLIGILTIITDLASQKNTNISVLLVGSFLGSGNFIDVDILGCLDIATGRESFVKSAKFSLEKTNKVRYVEMRSRIGSFPLNSRGLLTTSKLALLTTDSLPIDISFAGEKSGNIREIISFHQRSQLPYLVYQ